MAIVCEQMIKSQAEQLAGKPYSELKSPRRGSRDGRKEASPRTRPAEEGSLIDLQDSTAAPSASQSQVQRAFCAFSFQLLILGCPFYRTIVCTRTSASKVYNSSLIMVGA